MYKRIICMISAMVILMSFSVVSALSLDDYSLEDVYELIGSGNELPPWQIIKDIDVKAGEKSSLTGDSYNKLIKQREIAKGVVLGFGKGSKWEDFRKSFTKVATYDRKNREFKLVDESVETQDEFDSLLKKFDSSMTIATTRIMTGETVKTSFTTKFGRVIGKVGDNGIGTIKVLGFELVRIALTMAVLQTVAEMIYVSSDITRPFLGWQSKPIRLFHKRYDGGMETDEDHTVRFRVVGQAARAAVNKEYAISDMASVVKNDIFLSFFFSKIRYLILLEFGALLVIGNVWSTILIAIIQGLSNLFS